MPAREPPRDAPIVKRGSPEIIQSDSWVGKIKTVKNQPETLGLTTRISQASCPSARMVTGSPSAAKYNLSISHKHKFVWFRVAKNGTRTLLTNLKNNRMPRYVEQAYSARYPVGRYGDYSGGSKPMGSPRFLLVRASSSKDRVELRGKAISGNEELVGIRRPCIEPG